MRVLCQWFLVFTCHYEVGCSILGKLFFPDPPLPTWRWNSIGSLLDQASTSECILFLLGQKRKFEKRGLVCFSSERWFHFNYFLISCTCTVNVSLLVGPRSHSPWGPCRNSAVALCPLVLTTSGQLLTMSLILYVAGSRTWQILIGKRQLVWTPSVLVLLCIRSPRWTFSTWPMWSLGAPRFLTSTAYSTAGICLN